MVSPSRKPVSFISFLELLLWNSLSYSNPDWWFFFKVSGQLRTFTIIILGIPFAFLLVLGLLVTVYSYFGETFLLLV